MIEMIASGWPLYAVASLFGLLVGSFLNVVILRLPARLMHDWRAQSRDILGLGGESVALTNAAPDVAADLESAPLDTSTVEAALSAEAAPVTEAAPPDLVFTASHCPSCKHPLSPFENIPLLSWLVLGGRCRHCKAPISVQYPLIEALTAFAAFVIVWKFGFSWQAAAGLALSFSLIALAGIDFHTQLLPDNITQPLLWLGLLLSAVPVFISPSLAIAGAAVGYLSLWAVFWLFKLLTGKEGMGYGDFKLLAALGAWMGPLSLLPIILMSSLIGAIVGSIALAARGQDHSTPIPFGPFIAAAGWVQFVFGEQLQGLYWRLLGGA